jgi:hypothetical protein
MKKTPYVLILFLLFSCSRFSVAKGTVEDTSNQTPLQGMDEVQAEQEEDWLIIGGQKVEDFYKADKYYLKSEIESIEQIQLWIDPKDLNRTINLEGIEQLVNLRTIHLYGWELDALDYSPLSTLPNLRGILFESGKEDKLTSSPILLNNRI